MFRGKIWPKNGVNHIDFEGIPAQHQPNYFSVSLGTLVGGLKCLNNILLLALVLDMLGQSMMLNAAGPLNTEYKYYDDALKLFCSRKPDAIITIQTGQPPKCFLMSSLEVFNL